MIENFTSRTLKALSWGYLGTLVNASLQLGLTVIMARLLEPAAFGLVAMAGIILRFGQYFAQLGIGSSLIQKEELTKKDICAGFTSTTLLGFVFFCLTYVLAPLGLYLFNFPLVVPVLRAMGFSLFLSGLSTTALSLLRRKLAFRQLAVIDTISYLVGYGVIGIILALMGYGVWSLVIASLSQACLTAILAYLFERHIVLISFNWDIHKRLISYGGFVSIISFLEFIGYNIDTFAIGRVWGAQALGIYTRSLAIVQLPIEYGATTISKVMFSSFSLIQSDILRLRRSYYSSMMLVMVVIIPVGFGMMTAARELVLTLLGSKWISGIAILQILSVFIILSMGANLPGILCVSVGKLKGKFVIQLLYIFLVIMLISLTYQYGIETIAMMIVLASIFKFMAYQSLMRSTIGISYSDLFKTLLPGLLVSIAVVIGIISAQYLFRNLPLVALLCMEIIVAGILFILFVIIKPPKLLKEVIKQTLINLGEGKLGDRVRNIAMNWYQ